MSAVSLIKITKGRERKFNSTTTRLSYYRNVQHEFDG